MIKDDYRIETNRDVYDNSERGSYCDWYVNWLEEKQNKMEKNLTVLFKYFSLKIKPKFMIIEPPKTIEDFNKIKSTILELLQNPYADNRTIENLKLMLKNTEEIIKKLKL
jgi:hypothetical protein